MFKEQGVISLWIVLGLVGQLVDSSRTGWHQGEVSNITSLLVSTGLGSTSLQLTCSKLLSPGGAFGICKTAQMT